ncbi:tyrosine-protein phosphatase [Candidatus Enterococcus ferrettii]|uniref:Tyrosine specific protein phosphatases domain-containing protein n=1 Tax=Candidatus Enterococcus ferrettii TaxID=2815324 RepID=A0ABV0EQP0_9ENTE|nr:tyrosine-protein phosphatase [Enterococcus sp. 665A]MBO1339097.1 tyrosine-protein phosphatase [Enterococcus sp. 665A]
MINYTRLPLEGSFNTRELGGYPVKEGATHFQKFLRSDSLSDLTQQDVTFLENYGVRTIVDLRSDREVSESPNPHSPLIQNLHIPLVTGNVADATKDITKEMNYSMGSFYVDCLKRYPESLVKIFEAFAESEGCILFHCAAGKDRTGIVAAFLLELAGVSQADIIANYQITHTHLQANPSFKQTHGSYPIEMSYSLPNYIEEALDYLHSHFGTAENYLRSFGVSQAILTELKARMVLNEILV